MNIKQDKSKKSIWIFIQFLSRKLLFYFKSNFHWNYITSSHSWSGNLTHAFHTMTLNDTELCHTTPCHSVCFWYGLYELTRSDCGDCGDQVNQVIAVQNIYLYNYTYTRKHYSNLTHSTKDNCWKECIVHNWTFWKHFWFCFCRSFDMQRVATLE